jgi:hypothetical protein
MKRLPHTHLIWISDEPAYLGWAPVRVLGTLCCGAAVDFRDLKKRAPAQLSLPEEAYLRRLGLFYARGLGGTVRASGGSAFEAGHRITAAVDDRMQAESRRLEQLLRMASDEAQEFARGREPRKRRVRKGSTRIHRSKSIPRCRKHS